MAEALLITGLIGSDLHAVTCDATVGRGSFPVLGWIVSLLGVYDYAFLKANVAECTRLFARGHTTLLYTDATTPAPRPVIDRLTPRSVPVGSEDVLLHVYGRDFTPRAQIIVNGVPQPALFVGPTELTLVLAGTLSTPGEYPVQVQTAAPGGGLSGTRLFAILAP